MIIRHARRWPQTCTLSRLLKALCSLGFLVVLLSEKFRPCLVGVGVRGPLCCPLLLSAKGVECLLNAKISISTDLFGRYDIITGRVMQGRQAGMFQLLLSA